METGYNIDGHKFKVGDVIDWNMSLHEGAPPSNVRLFNLMSDTYGVITELIGGSIRGCLVRIQLVYKSGGRYNSQPIIFHIDWCLPRDLRSGNTINVKVDYLGNFLDNELSNEDKLIIKKYLLDVSN